MRVVTYCDVGKRVLDLAVSMVVLVLLAPVLMVTAVLVRVRLGSPVIFRQRRPGRDGRPFQMWKFRTMTDARDVRENLLPDEQRLTRFGQLLRSTSLDELPELWNVLRGEMSLVGPRPLLMEYLDRYTPEQARRHEARPGITGWAQVNGRNSLSWEEKFEHDVWYVEHCSLGLDLKILWKTLVNVVRRDGIHAAGHATMPKFQGFTSNEPKPHDEPGDGVVVIGAGGHAKVVIATLQAAGHDVQAVFDDDASRWGQEILGIAIEGPIRRLEGGDGRPAVLAIGDNDLRRKLAANLNLRWLSVVHPAATVHESVELNPGAVVFAGAVVQPDAVIGCHAIVNTGASVDHDGRIGDFVHIGPGARLAGEVRLDEGVFVGAGAVVIPGVTVRRGSVVGAGSTVLGDVPEKAVAVGSPARHLAQSVPKAA